MTNLRQPNFKLGWLIPNHIAALSHFHPEVTMEDFMGVVQTGEKLLSDVENEFHVIIDNREVAMSSPASLSQMKEMVSYMRHPMLRWVVVIKPTTLDLDTSTLPIEQAEKSRLKNVASLDEAIDYLQAQTKELEWEKADRGFFQ